MYTPENSEALRSLRILVLEDDVATHDMLMFYLESTGHTVSSAFTVGYARHLLETVRYDVFIADIGLPDGDSWELMRTVKWFHPLYAIATSGYGLEEDRARSRAVGFRHHLLKPCKLSALDEALREAARETASAGSVAN